MVAWLKCRGAAAVHERLVCLLACFLPEGAVGEEGNRDEWITFGELPLLGTGHAAADWRIAVDVLVCCSRRVAGRQGVVSIFFKV